MASLVAVKGKRGTSYEVQFCDGADRRPKIRLGRVPKKTAQATQLRIEFLIAAKAAAAAIDAETARWLDGIGDDLHERLARVGLVPHRHGTGKARGAGMTVAALADRYVGRRELNLKPNTIRKLKQARRALVEHFGENRAITTITAGEAADWREEMLQGLSEASVATHIKCAKSFFSYAVDSEFIDRNPFGKVKAGSQRNSRRRVFVPGEVISKILDVCPDLEWRLIIVLARYGGLRTPSELQDLKWGDIHWGRNRIVIHAKKKEHLDGHQTREIPIFAEIAPYLEEAYERAAEGAVYVVPRARQAGVNLRTQFERLLRKAGVPQWTRLFQNLRASRQTELTGVYAAHLVNHWMGNSRQVAEDHYLMPTDADFERASKNPVQIPVQSQPITGSQETAEDARPTVLPAIACYTGVQVPSTGIEPVTFNFGG